MVPRSLAAFVIALLALPHPAIGQASAYEKARDQFRESIRRPTLDDRLPGIRALADAGDIRAADDLLAALKTIEPAIEKKRDEIERVGRENRDIWKVIDAQASAGRPVTQGDHDRAVAKYEALQKKLDALNDELALLEGTRAALHEGIGRVLGAADAGARAPKILALAAATQQAGKTDDKIAFVRLFGAIRTPESRDALAEIARLNQDGLVRTVAVTALGEHCDAAAIPVLTDALKDDVWAVQIAAARALANIPSIDSVPGLAAALTKSESATTDAIVKALEDITGVTYHDNGPLWAEWHKREAGDIASALKGIESPEASVRAAALDTIATKGVLAAARLLLLREGLDPARDAASKYKRSRIAPPGPPASESPEDTAARRAAIGGAIKLRPKTIRDRAVASMFVDPLGRARALGDVELQSAYLRAAAAVPDKAVFEILKRYADRDPEGKNAGDEEATRRVAIEALGWHPTDTAVTLLGQVLKRDKTSIECKKAAIAALQRQKHEDCITPLLDALLDKPPVAEAAAKALAAMTGGDQGADRQKWRDWWHDTGRFKVQLRKQKTAEEEQQEEVARGEGGRGTSFYGIETRSKRLVYVLDVSGSMNEGHISGATGARAETRIQTAKRELKASIVALPEDANFNIVLFADGVQLWKPKLQVANKATKAEVTQWIDDIKAVGATNIFDALEKAFELAGRGAVDKRYNLAVDTIMLLSDGQPNRGRLTDARSIVAEVARMNEFKKVAIHVVGIGKDHNAPLMKALANANGGTYTDRQ